MGGITFSGLGSGIDTATIIEQLMSVERQPLTKLETKKTNKEQALNIYSDLRSKLNDLKAKASAMNSIREFRKMSAASSDEDVFTVSADNTASAGKHTIKVLSLAQAEMEVSQGYSATTSSIGTGTFSVSVGSETPIEITIDSSNNTLAGLAQAINNSGAEVTASIMNDGDATNPYRLVVASNETGTANEITLDASGLSGGTAPTFTNGAGGTAGQQASDSTLLFDGVNVTKSSNEIDDLLTGVTINLLEVDTENTHNLTIESNVEQIKETINDFVTSNNDLVDYLKSKSGDDALHGDYTFASIKRQIQTVISGSIDNIGGQYSALSQIGLTTDSNGHLVVDDEDLTDALEDNFDDVMQVFTSYSDPTSPYVQFLGTNKNTAAGTYNIEITGVGANFAATINGNAAVVSGSGNIIYGAQGTPEEGLMLSFSGTAIGSYGSVDVSIGVMEKMERLLSIFTDFTSGTIKTKEESIRRSINSIEGLIEREEDALNKVESRLTKQFTQMETTLSQLQTQGSFLNSLSLY